MSDLKKKFEDAAAAVKKLKEDPGNDAKLQLYALYKQGAEGDVAGQAAGLHRHDRPREVRRLGEGEGHVEGRRDEEVRRPRQVAGLRRVRPVGTGSPVRLPGARLFRGGPAGAFVAALAEVLVELPRRSRASMRGLEEREQESELRVEADLVAR